MDAAIKINELSVKLGKNFKALSSISLELPAGKITGLMGPSGAGKTTLIHAIVGSQKIDSGTITVLGKPAGSKDLRRQVGYMSQELSVYTDLTVSENLNYFLAMIGRHGKTNKHDVRRVLELVDLLDKSSNLVSDLSGGQKQRVSLAVALLDSPDILILDEPTVGLDPVLRERLWDLFSKLAAQGMTLVVSSHSMDEASRCENLVLIRDGMVVAHDSPDEFLAKTKTKSIEEGFIKLVRNKK